METVAVTTGLFFFIVREGNSFVYYQPQITKTTLMKGEGRWKAMCDLTWQFIEENLCV